MTLCNESQHQDNYEEKKWGRTIEQVNQENKHDHKITWKPNILGRLLWKCTAEESEPHGLRNYIKHDWM